MKKILLGFIFLFAAFHASDSQEVYKFRLLLTDKNGSGYSVGRPDEFLSDKALAGRLKYGIPIDESDLPVSEAYLSELRQQGVRIVCSSKWMNSVVIACSDSLAGIGLKNLPFVDSVKVVWKNKAATLKSLNIDPTSAVKSEMNATSVNFTEDDDYYGKAATQIKMHNGDLLHNAGYKGSGMTIAVIDAGFRKANTIDGLKNSIVGEKDFVVPDGDVYAADISDHGIKVLSTMAANIPNTMVGTAPEASYWLLRSEDVSSEFPVEEDYWAAAAEFADSIGVNIINSSLGYTTFDYPTASYTKDQLDGKTAFISQAANYAARKGILVCNSAGNSGSAGWRLVNCPGDAENILTVGSVTKDSIKAASSSVGPTADGRIKPEVVAMGASACVLDESGNVAFSSGTSFASPIMAGLAACLWQALPELSNTELIDLLEKYASQSDMPDYDYGYGIPDVFKAYLEQGSQIKISQKNINKPTIFMTSSGMLCIRNLSSAFGNYSVIIYNTCGNALYRRTSIAENGTFDVSSLQKGVYLVAIQGKDESYTCKVVK
ncbi:MAG: S8 family serine peptidase [Candidatus Azobacteroides sp.]|nr:S8 family serine peptidase [Candidatus Azobacteroides sp.]